MQGRRIAKLVVAGGASLFWLSAQNLTITPNRVLTDQIAVVRATGLQPGEHVTLKADLVDGDGQRWESDAEFAADDRGGIDLSTQASGKGPYKEISAIGPIWSMMPVEKGVSAYHPPQKLGSQEIRFQLIRGGAVMATLPAGPKLCPSGMDKPGIPYPAGQLISVALRKGMPVPRSMRSRKVLEFLRQNLPDSPAPPL
jgi:hypothetical protein